MADLILLSYTTGRREITAVCPTCGRIDRLALQEPCTSLDSNPRQILQHGIYTCPVCHQTFFFATNKDSAKWGKAYGRYLQDEEEYNKSAEVEYRVRTMTGTLQSAASSSDPRAAIGTTEVPSKTMLASAKRRNTIALSKKIEGWKRELLDTGKRNRMINYKETKRSTLKILDPSPKDLFNHLMFSEKPLSFQKPIDKRSDIRTFSMLALLETLSYSLPAYKGDIKAAGAISERERTLRNLRAKAKLAQEEQGTNILYLSFGFIVWKNGADFMRSPLLLMPVSITQKSLNAPFLLTKTDDDIEVNPTLKHLFNSEFNIDLPTFELNNSRASFEEYMSTIERLVDKRGWRLVREVSLGLLSFLKISMYNDLNEHQEMIKEHPVLRAMADSEPAYLQLPAEVQNYDFDQASPNDWFEVVDADSSQEEAILLSRQGVSFVLQGPPGTGKSQTITNIIADSLANGKKVLFVSEKAAALQVVLKRLKEVKLDDFCLSLHDYKANKKEIVQNIGANLDLEQERASRGLLNDLVELQNDRVFLSKYAKELHQIIMPLDESIYSVFGKLSKLDAVENVPVEVDRIAAVSDTELANWLYYVDAFERALHNMGGTLSSNPWKGTSAKSYSTAFQKEISEAAGELPDNLNRLDEELTGLSEYAHFDVEHTWNGMQKGLESIRRILSLPLFPATWLSENEIHTRLILADRENQRRQDVKLHSETVTNLITQIDAAWDIPLLKYCYDDVLKQREVNVQDCVIRTKLNQRKGLLLKSKEAIDTLKENYEEAIQLFGLVEDNRPNVVRTSHLVRMVSDAPYMEAMWFDVRKTEGLLSSVEEIEARQNKIHEKKNVLLSEWEPAIFEIDAKGMLGRFKTDYSGILYKLKSSYKDDIKTVKLLSKNVRKSITDTEVISILQAIAELDEEKRWFTEATQKMNNLFGAMYQGMDTDTARIREGVQAAAKIANLFPYANVPASVVETAKKASADLQLGATMRRLSEALSIERITACEEALQNANYEKHITDVSTAIDEASLWTVKRIQELSEREDYLADLEAAKKDGIVHNTDLQMLLAYIDQLTTELNWIEAHYSGWLTETHAFGSFASLVSLIDYIQRASKEVFIDKNEAHENELTLAFGTYYRDAETDWSAIIDVLNQVKAYLRSDYQESHLPFIQRICNDSVARITLREKLDSIDLIRKQSEHGMSVFCVLFPNEKLEDKSLLLVAEKYSSCMSDFLSLNKWIEYMEAKEQCDSRGLKNFTDRIERADNTIINVKAAFEKGFYIAWLSSVLDQYPSVQQFRRGAHETKLTSFVKLDSKQFGFSTNRIRRKLIESFPSSFDGIMRPERAILMHEMSKKMRIKPLRRLFREIPHLLLTLKPCLMMSPLSVAYFLNADDYKFDVVIFDEASQIFPQDAIGSIFRAKQVIIAGDTKQLPPTNFFSTTSGIASDEYDSDDEYEEEIYDSILEETATVLPSKMLLWHYRSKHEHLIAFSNQELYENKLVTFPNQSMREPDTGVEYVYVADGFYEKAPRNCNVEEARKCVELVREHIEKYPNRSLGIIAFSEKQQQAITLEIQRFRESNPRYEFFFEEGKEDEFFVKNLENVQGDERDTIIFSIGYAKTKEQRSQNKGMSMNFGPLTKQGGERRLNVAITRAKINVKLVGSIMPSDIDLERTESEGVRMLRSYIEFARNGEVSLASANKKQIQDDFVDTVFDFLQEKGYKVKKHVGCSGYKIDIVIENPNYEGEYAAGVECDGVVYARAHTARDRDRLRRSVLTGMGWHLYRVWSSEWMTNAELEARNLLAFVDNAIRESDERVRVIEEKRLRAEAERKKAEEIRREEEERLRREKEQEETRKKWEKEQKAYEHRLQVQKQKEAERKELNARKQVKVPTKKSEPSSMVVSQPSLFQGDTVLNGRKPSIRDRIQDGTDSGQEKRDEAENILSAFHVGDAVTHSVYGKGTVTSVGASIKIRFENGEEKGFGPMAVKNGYLKR